MSAHSQDETIRTSAIIAGTGEGVRHFRNPDEMDAKLRRRFEKSLAGDLTATILLADDSGQEYLKRRAAGASLPVRTEQLRNLVTRRLLIEVAAAAAVVLGLWLATISR